MVFFAIAATLLSLGGLTVTALGVWFGGAWLRFANYHRHKGLPLPDGPTVGRRLQHVIAEGIALIQIHIWRLERGPTTMSPPDGAALPPVLCVHGFTQDRTNFSAFRRALWSEGRSSVAVDLGLPGKHPRRFAKTVIEALDDLRQRFPDDQLDIVCHSMGGLVLRDALAQRPDLAPAIHAAITLGSPHHGTAAARGPLRLWPEADGLSRGSAWIADLPSLHELLPAARTVTVCGTADYIVYPASTCHLRGSEAVQLHGIGHAGLLTRPEVVEIVLAVLHDQAIPQTRLSMTPAPPANEASRTPMV